MTDKLEELQERVTFWLHWIAVAVTSVILVAVVVLVYWALEPDPLTVNPHGNHISVCSEREFTFERYVHSSKPLDIYVQQRYINKNGVQGLDEVVNQGVVKWNF